MNEIKAEVSGRGRRDPRRERPGRRVRPAALPRQDGLTPPPGRPLFKRILIANRGEIALRVIRACRELGIESVVVYSKADANAPWLDLADDAICIGPAPSAKSYLNIPNIISGGRDRRRRRDPPRLRVPLGERALRRDLPLEQHRVHRPERGRDPPHGQQERGEGRGQEGRRPARRGQRRPGRVRGGRARDGAEDRLPGAHQGGERRRRARHARRPQRHLAGEQPAVGAGRGRGRVRRPVRVPREVPRGAAPRRDPDPRRQVAARSSTSASATARSSAGTRRSSRRRRAPRSRRTCARRWAGPRSASRRTSATTAPARSSSWSGQGVLLHRGQRAHPGRAPGHRDAHAHRPRQDADPRRGRRAPAVQAGRHHVRGARDRVPDQRRGPRPGLRAVAGPRSRPTPRPAVPASASTRTRARATASRRTTTA